MIVQTAPEAASFPATDQHVVTRRKPLALRRVPRETVRYLNQIGLQRRSLEFSWLSKRWTLEITPLAKPMIAFAEVVTIDWGGADVRMRVGAALLETAMRGALQVDRIGAVDGEVRAVLIEAAFAGLATQIEAQTRKRFRLVETRSDSEAADSPSDDPVWEDRHGFSLLLSDGEFDYPCEAWIDDLALGFLANALREWRVQAPAIEQWSALPVHATLSAGWTTLSLRTVRRLGIHDVILLDECLVGGEEDLILIRLGTRFGIRGKLAGSTITITDWLDEIMDETDDFEDFDDLDDDKEAMPVDSDGESDSDSGESLDQIPVRVNFDLGERTMTLAEIRSLAPGYVMELGRDVRRAVTIRVNGRKIGEGELVDIDGYIGVSLLSINPPSA